MNYFCNGVQIPITVLLLQQGKYIGMYEFLTHIIKLIKWVILSNIQSIVYLLKSGTH